MFQRDSPWGLDRHAQASGHSGAPSASPSLTALGPRTRPSPHDCLAFLSISAPVLTQSVPKPLAALCCHVCEDRILKEDLLCVCALVILREAAILW